MQSYTTQYTPFYYFNNNSQKPVDEQKPEDIQVPQAIPQQQVQYVYVPIYITQPNVYQQTPHLNAQQTLQEPVQTQQLSQGLQYVYQPQLPQYQPMQQTQNQPILQTQYQPVYPTYHYVPPQYYVENKESTFLP